MDQKTVDDERFIALSTKPMQTFHSITQL